MARSASRADPDLISGLLLARLDDASRRALASHAHLQTLRSGHVVFRQGDPADALYVVVEGELRVLVGSASGDEAALARIGPGEACGELGLIDGQPRSATVVAARESKVLAVSRTDFVNWLRPRPEAALALLETLSLRLRRMNVTATDLVFLDLTHRLAKALLELSGGAGAPKVIRVTQVALASMLGVSRESVNKELNALARKGVIGLGRGSITVLDASALDGS